MKYIRCDMAQSIQICCFLGTQQHVRLFCYIFQQASRRDFAALGLWAAIIIIVDTR